MQKKIEQLQIQISEKNSEILELSQEREVLGRGNRSLETDLKLLAEQHAEESRTLKGKIAELQAQQGEFESELQVKENDINHLETYLQQGESLQKEITSLKTENNELHAVISQSETAISELESISRNLTEEVAEQKETQAHFEATLQSKTLEIQT